MDNAEALFEKLRTGGAAYIQSLIDETTPESLILDFKEKSTPDGHHQLGDDDKSNYSRALSGFANSSGGVLVWGVAEVAKGGEGVKTAFEAKPIANVSAFVRSLNDLLPNAVVRAVDGVRNEAILLPGEPNTGYVVTFVPESEKAPHRAEFAKKHGYYRRTGSSFVPMEHYELEDMFGRRQRPKLEAAFDYNRIELQSRLHYYDLFVRLTNVGKAMALHLGYDLEFPKDALSPGNNSQYAFLFATYNHWKVHLTNEDLYVLTFRSPVNAAPLFPGETADPVRHVFLVNDRIHDTWENELLTLRLYADNAPVAEEKVRFGTLMNY